MPLISHVGRRSASTRMLIAGLYAVLALGGISMVYPFVLLVAGSFKTGVDIKEVSWRPAFLFDDLALYRKHIESLFNEQLDVMRSVYDIDAVSFDQLAAPEPVSPGLLQAWEDFVAGDDDALAYTTGYMRAPVSRTVPKFLRAFRERMKERFGPSIDDANEQLGTQYTGWNAFYLLPEDMYQRRSKPLDSRLGEEWRAYRSELPSAYRYYFTLEGFYKTLFLKTQFTRDISEYNRIHGTDYASYDELRLPARFPADGKPKEQASWEQFVRNTLNLRWIKLDEEAEREYERYLEAKYGSLEAARAKYTSDRSQGSDASERESFIAGWTDPETGRTYQPPAESLRLESVEENFRAFLRARWSSLDALNRALQTSYADWSAIMPPQQAWHYQQFLERRGEIRAAFLTRNFLTALDHLLYHGRGIRNTIIYCALAVLSALLVNPLAAYAMSRYKPPSSYKLLLFLLLTMAFPPMVTQIPVFLMLRDLNLLNTFAALLLPGLAHGYSIFLLKGFFDALPRDLYESAEIDGAGEWTMFWQITMSLSKPILAVVALQAFTTAYANFMFALLICQDERMWTMMVWLYQLQMSSGPGVVYASLLIAAIPTLIIFMFCQNIILRGIVVPVEK